MTVNELILSELTEKEQERFIKGAKEGDKLKIQIIIDNLCGLKISSYKAISNENVNIDWEDYNQECNVKIIECINNFKKKNYWQLYKLVEKSIKNRTLDFSKKNKHFNDLNIPYGDRMDIYALGEEEQNFDDLVISNMATHEICSTVIKKKLSKGEHRVFSSIILGHDFEEYASKNGVKTESVKRIFRRAVIKLKNTKEIKQLQFIGLVILILMQNVSYYVDLLGISALTDFLV